MNLEQSPQPKSTVRLMPLAQPATASVIVPGSKSYTIRALLLAALTPKQNQEPVRITNPLFSDDGQAVLSCLHELGIQTTTHRENHLSWIEVHNDVSEIQMRDYTLDADLSAATLRFLLALSAVIPGRQVLHGKPGLNNRPVRDLVDALRAIGADIEYLERDGYPPVRVNSSRIEAHRFQVSGATSSQYVSALLMIAPYIHAQQAAGQAQDITIELIDEPVSKPYLDMTAAIMRDFGVQVEHADERTWIIPAGQNYRATEYVVEPDASSLAYFLAIAALTRSSVTIPHLNSQSVQADMEFVRILQSLGHRAEWNENALTLHGQPMSVSFPETPNPLVINMEDCPDQAQTLAVLAAFWPVTTRIEGLQSLRVKETDRIAATARELIKMGIHVEEEPDALVIHGGNPQPARISTYGDHRMAMAFAVSGANIAGLEIEDPTVVNKTYPGFWEDLQSLGIGVQWTTDDEPLELSMFALGETTQKHLSDDPAGRIVLIGFMGAGKSAVAEIIAEKLNLPLVEMDARIVQASGRNSVAEIFDQDGETYFRALETATAQALDPASATVISTGGGVVMSEAAMVVLSVNSILVFLETRLETLLNRLAHCGDRPLLRDKEQFSALFELRQPHYHRYAHMILSTDEKTPTELADAILQNLGLPASIAAACSVN
jgi:3-phosphoshikimate 1-carboxyvinyltransferase